MEGAIYGFSPKKNAPSEAKRFIKEYGLSSSASIFAGGRTRETIMDRFLRTHGKICLAFIDNLIEEISKGNVDIPKSSSSPKKATSSKGAVNPKKNKTMQSDIDPRVVFVVHGRNIKARDALFQFLRSIDLRPLEWSDAIERTGKATPYVGEILDVAFAAARAVVVLFTPDDVAMLDEKYRNDDDEKYETELTPQARPNVLFEAGMAMGRNPDKTILIELGRLRPFSDVGGRHIMKLKDTVASRQDLAQRLKRAGCAVNLVGTAWHGEGTFALEETSLDLPKFKVSIDDVYNLLSTQVKPSRDALKQRQKLAKELVDNCKLWSAELIATFDKAVKKWTKKKNGKQAARKEIESLQKGFLKLDYWSLRSTSPILLFLKKDNKFNNFAESCANFYESALNVKRIAYENIEDSSGLVSLRKNGISKIVNAWKEEVERMMEEVNVEYLKVKII